MDLAQQFRDQAAQANPDHGRKSWRYSDALRALAVEYHFEQHEAGQRFSVTARKLGITTLMLSQWIKAHHRNPEAGLLRPVTVAAEIAEPVITEMESSSPGLTLVTPNGLRVEGVSWDQVLQLLGAES